MIEKIPRELINTLVKHTNIVELIKKRINLIQKGKNFISLCPFHNEKTPSFTVSYEKQFFYCFGCGIYGNVIDFLINYDKYSFIESIRELSEINNINIFTIKNKEFIKDKYFNVYYLYSFLKKINNFYQKNLQKKSSFLALKYLKNRGFSKSIISYFNIGFSSNEWKSISNKFGNSEKNNKLLYDTGMIVYSKNGIKYDRFRERIMIPIKNQYGNIIAFGARSINDIFPKYINSPETKIFSKRKELYGLYEAKKNKIKIEKLLLVEGYFDVISLAQYNINYAVSSLGTSINSNHIQILYRFTDNVICCYDGDDSGKKAAWNLLKKSLIYLKDGYQLKFIFLPNKEDPDTLIRKIGFKKFEKLINNAKPFSKFLFEKFLYKIKLTNIEDHVKFISLTLPLIQKIPGNNLKLHIRKKLANILGFLNEFELEKFFPIRSSFKLSIINNSIKNTTMRILIGLLIQNPKLHIYIKKTNKFYFSKTPGVKFFIKLINLIKINPNITTGLILEIFRNNICYKKIKKILLSNNMISENVTKKIFLDSLKKLKNSLLIDRQEMLLSLEKIRGLNFNEKKELWSLNKFLANK
ncbi:DNA primase [Sodalis-like secondary symbiont of Drepanosiphum platanoidis]|uniref:DNA primase n=1 Tax=Sodalis-like secondary symbiont of Drepanosiphum platanoidis TaxID=2994493 RepID=UPI003464A93F